ncbi:hypothetical protein [Marinicellulosiphila megalodicopiae]|uniref:hypothetical protein n=1 Tax=Marinicellulosiphila megalodicopiae TaxID=2724896 RepID=UPI003BB0DD26
MKLKFLLFILIIAGIVAAMLYFEGKREPVKFSEVFFSQTNSPKSASPSNS